MNVLYKIAAMMVIGLGLFNLGACNQTTGNGKSAGPPASVTKASAVAIESELERLVQQPSYTPEGAEVLYGEEMRGIFSREQIFKGKTINYQYGIFANIYQYDPDGTVKVIASRIDSGSKGYLRQSAGRWKIVNNKLCRVWVGAGSGFESRCEYVVRMPNGNIAMAARTDQMETTVYLE